MLLGMRFGLDIYWDRSLDAVELSEYMYHEGKKRYRQINRKYISAAVQQDMLECSIEKQLRETGGVLSSIDYANQERKITVSVEEIVMSDDLKTYLHPTDSWPMFYETGMRDESCMDEETEDASRNNLGSLDEVENID